MTESNDEYYLILEPHSTYPALVGSHMFLKSDFEKYFDVQDHYYATLNRKKHGECSNCQCHRWDSFICNHELNHAKSWFSMGTCETPVKLLGIYWLEGSWFG